MKLTDKWSFLLKRKPTRSNQSQARAKLTSMSGTAKAIQVAKLTPPAGGRIWKTNSVPNQFPRVIKSYLSPSPLQPLL